MTDGGKDVWCGTLERLEDGTTVDVTEALLAREDSSEDLSEDLRDE